MSATIGEGGHIGFSADPVGVGIRVGVGVGVPGFCTQNQELIRFW